MNRSQVARLMSGISAWNEWREIESEAQIDLSYADLSHADLSHANLNDANLSHADLSYANLSRTELNQADLSHANLSHTDLSYADLSYADLSYASLAYADLDAADLSHADFHYANKTPFGMGRGELGIEGFPDRHPDLARTHILHDFFPYHANLDAKIPFPVTLFVHEDDSVSDAHPLTTVAAIDLVQLVDPADIAALVSSAASFARVSARLGNRPWGGRTAHDDSAPMSTITASGGPDIRVARMRYGSPLSIAFQEFLDPLWTPLVLAGGGALRDILKGPDKSALLNTALLIVKKDLRAAFLEAQMRRYQNAFPASDEVVLKVPAMTPSEVADNLNDSVPDPTLRSEVHENLPGLTPLISQGFTITSTNSGSPPSD